MRRFLLCVSVLWPIAASGCGVVPAEDLVGKSSALSTVTSDGIRGYWRSDNTHGIVFKSASTGLIQQLAENPFGNGVKTTLGGVPANSPPWGYKRSDNTNAVVYLDNSGHVHELAESGSSAFGLGGASGAGGAGGATGGTWSDTDFTAASFIAAPAGQTMSNGPTSSEILAYIRTDGISAVIYRGQNDHIYEVTSNFPNFPPWLVNDLTVFTGAPNVGLAGPVPYIGSDQRNAIVYVATDRHIHQIRSNFGSSPAWADSDLFVASGETVSPGGAGPWPYRRADHSGNGFAYVYDAIVFIGSDGKLHELSIDVVHGGAWTAGIISSATTPGPLNRPSAYVRADGQSAVVYVSSSGGGSSLHELLLSSTGWVDGILPAAGGTPVMPFGQFAPGTRSSVLYVAHDPNQPSNLIGGELSLVNGGSSWQNINF